MLLLIRIEFSSLNVCLASVPGIVFGERGFRGPSGMPLCAYTNCIGILLAELYAKCMEFDRFHNVKKIKSRKSKMKSV